VFVLSVAAGVYWGSEKHVTGQLQGRLDGMIDNQELIDRLRREHLRLIRLQPKRAEIAEYGKDSQASGTSPNVGTGSLRTGLWAASSAWKNEGRATPEAAVETMLWAAAGGDLDVLHDTLVLTPDARSKAAEILDRLPAETRQQYLTPEDLMGVVVAGNVPLGSAQLVARQQNWEGQATEFLRLKDSSGRTRLVYLQLRQAPDGWKLTVPKSAVEQIEFQPSNTVAP
jgi:hypothetical protein